MRTIKAIVLHHTGGNSFGPEDGSEVRDMVVRMAATRFAKWYPTEYNYLIALNGKVWNDASDETTVPHCGRDYGIYEDMKGYSLGVYNQNSIAVAVVGDFQKLGSMPEKQYLSILEVLKTLKKKYPQAWILLHKEIVSTDCPGVYYPFAKILKEYNMEYPTDIDPKAWYYPAVKFVLDKQIMKGDENYKFNPNKPLTRAEMAQIIKNLSDKKVIIIP